MNKLLLDTGPVIRYMRGRQSAIRLLRSISNMYRLSISVVTRLEIHAGMLDKERFATQKFLGRFLTLDLDRTIADRTGDLIHNLRRQGTSIETTDAIIAATALNHQVTLVTYNLAHFRMIPGLSLYPLSENEL